MDNAEVNLLAQLLNSMSEAVEKLDRAYNSKKVEEVEKMKKEITNIHKKIDSMIRR